MSWHEPGRDRDPWRDPKEGPPDLDEWLRRARRRVRGWFARRHSPRPRGSRRLNLWWLIPPILVIVWLLTGFFRVPADHQAVTLRFGVYTGLFGPGLHWHWPWPIASDRMVDLSEGRSISQQAQVLTRDGQLLNLGVTVAYRISSPYKYLFGSRSPAQLITALANAALAGVARTENSATLRSKDLSALEGTLKARIADALVAADAGVTVHSVKIGRVDLPQAVEDSRQALVQQQKSNAEEARKALAAVGKKQAAARDQAAQLIADAERDAAAREALARERAAHFAALLPAWQKSPAVARATLRASVLADALEGIPKVVVSGSVHSVTLPPLSGTAGAARPAPVPGSGAEPGSGAP